MAQASAARAIPDAARTERPAESWRMNRFQAIDPALLGLRPGDRLVDVGCGIGRHVLELSKVRGCHVGVDQDRIDLMKALYWSVAMCIEGKAPRRIQAAQADATVLPFVDAAFDRVVSTEMLEHVPDDRAVLGELVRVLRPGGTLAVSVPAETSERILWRLSAQYRNAVGGHVRIYSHQGLTRLVEEAGLRPYAVRYRHSVETVYWLVRILDSKSIDEEGPLTSRVRRYLGAITPRFSNLLDRLDAAGNYLLPKSIVLYARKPGEAAA